MKPIITTLDLMRMMVRLWLEHENDEGGCQMLDRLAELIEAERVPGFVEAYNAVWQDQVNGQ